MNSQCLSIVGLTLALLPALPVTAAPVLLSCAPDQADNVKAMENAPRPVVRRDEHQLEVGWQRGRRLFRDLPPFDEPLAGVRWRYCSFDAGSGQHLISKTENELRTGVLLDHRSGAVTEAGHSVLLSPEGRLVLGVRQPDGLDGEEWVVSRLKGALLWKGYSFITRPGTDTVMADLSQPAWVGPELTAQLTCLSDYMKDQVPRHTVTLKKSGHGYSWQPQIECAAGPQP